MFVKRSTLVFCAKQSLKNTASAKSRLLGDFSEYEHQIGAKKEVTALSAEAKPSKWFEPLFMHTGLEVT